MMEIAMVLRRRPNKANAKGMFVGERSKQALIKSEAHGRRRRRAIVKSVVKYHGDGWRALGFAMKAHYRRLATKRRAENHVKKNEDLEHSQAALELHDVRTAAMAEFHRHTLRSQEFRLTDDDHRHLQLKWATKQLGNEQVKQREAEISKPVDFLHEIVFQDMLRIREQHLGPEEITIPTYEWVREVCRRYLWFEGSVLCVTPHAEDDQFYLLRNIGVGTHELSLLPLTRIPPVSLGAYCASVIIPSERLQNC